MSDLFRQSVYSRLAGYEHLNDAERLAVDPAFRMLASRERRKTSVALTSTLHWFETEALRRLAQSILRVANDARIDLPPQQFPPDVGIDDIEQVYGYGVLYMARALWEDLGIGALLREQMPQDGCEAPHDLTLLAMTANRLARPASTLACYERWLADDVYWPEAQTLALEQLYRALPPDGYAWPPQSRHGEGRRGSEV